MSTTTVAHDAFSATSEAEARCKYLPCARPFKTNRTWQTFCSGPCRSAFHAAEARKAAINKAAPALFEALRRIAAGELTEGETPVGVATAAVKDLRAP